MCLNVLSSFDMATLIMGLTSFLRRLVGEAYQPGLRIVVSHIIFKFFLKSAWEARERVLVYMSYIKASESRQKR